MPLNTVLTVRHIFSIEAKTMEKMEKWNYKKINLITVRSVFKYPQGHEFLCLNLVNYLDEFEQYTILSRWYRPFHTLLPVINSFVSIKVSLS